MNKKIILIMCLLIANVVLADETGVSTSVSVTHKTSLEISIDNFFNNQTMIAYPISYMLGRRITAFEFYSLIFCIIFIIIVISILAIKIKHNKKEVK